MSSHPDADAFMRVFLRSPPDATTRLVFADWLEETGRPWNVAWAYYIRLKAEADRHPFGSPEREELEEQAAEYIPHIRAELTIPVDVFLGYPKSLLQLLPPANITVRLEGFTPPTAVLRLLNRELARVYRLFPLDRQGNVVLVAMSDRRNIQAVDDLENLFGLHFISVLAAWPDIRRAIGRHYPPGGSAGQLAG